MSDAVIHSRTSGLQRKTWALWTLQILAALAFLAAGGSKLAGVENMVALFDQIGLGQWLRYLTGVLEVGGAILLLVPRTAWIGGALLAYAMLGAVLTHLVIGDSPVLALLLFSVTALIAWHRWPGAVR